MVALIALLTLALVALVVVIVSAPLRRSPAVRAHLDRGSADTGERPAGTLERDELEAAREAKYREIRDCELDFRTGKLSRADYEAIDAQLRSEALAVLDRLQALEGGAGEDGAEAD